MHHSRLCAVLIDCNTSNIDEAAEFWSSGIGSRRGPSKHPGSRGNYRMLEDQPDYQAHRGRSSAWSTKAAFSIDIENRRYPCRGGALGKAGRHSGGPSGALGRHAGAHRSTLLRRSEVQRPGFPRRIPSGGTNGPGSQDARPESRCIVGQRSRPARWRSTNRSSVCATYCTSQRVHHTSVAVGGHSMFWPSKNGPRMPGVAGGIIHFGFRLTRPEDIDARGPRRSNAPAAPSRLAENSRRPDYPTPSSAIPMVMKIEIMVLSEQLSPDALRLRKENRMLRQAASSRRAGPAQRRR